MVVNSLAGAVEDCTACVRYIAEVQFDDDEKDRLVEVDAGSDVVIKLSEANLQWRMPGPEIGRRRLTVFDRGQKISELPESFYVSFVCVEKEHRTYWVIEEYTGGMHCCIRYHFFSKSGQNRPMSYVGATDGTMSPRENPWVCKANELYYEDSDIRFVYFHGDYASSRLYVPRFYHLNDSSLKVKNITFAEVYQKEISRLNVKIAEMTKHRNDHPRSIISRDEARHFSDELGQILVRRTIFYLYARDNQKAWGTFLKDVQSSYKTIEGVDLLIKEIEKLLKEGPY
jgi:hypothetical protein